MKTNRKIYVYPLTKESLDKENNTYVTQLIKHLSKEFTLSNSVTEIGLIDALAKFTNTDIYYFNWVENLPTKRFGLIQVILLVLLLILCKIFNKKIVWFVHNNISHEKKYFQVKKFIVWIMAKFADLVFAHSNEIKTSVPKEKLHIFHHPIEHFHPLDAKEHYKFDLLIWGAVLPYKGVAEFVENASASQVLSNQKLLIAGRFREENYYDRVQRAKYENVTVVNRFIADSELIELFSQSRYILFTYASASILSSAALCKSLAFGKEVVAPNVGSFKELSEKDLVYTYSNFAELESLLTELKENKRQSINYNALQQYIQNTSWDAFSIFLYTNINSLFYRFPQEVRRPSV